MKNNRILFVGIFTIGCALIWIYLTGGFDEDDILLYSIIIGCIGLILSMLKSRSGSSQAAPLTRAMTSAKKDLIRERDILETQVIERTAELKKLQTERAMEMSRIAEFGRLAQGLFHDLMTPLTSLALHVEGLQSSIQSEDAYGNSMRDTQAHVQKAIRASERMGAFMKNIRRHIQYREPDGMEETGTATNTCHLEHEAKLVTDLLSYKARENGVDIEIISEQDSSATDTEKNYPANPFYFHQIFLNLISNALDAFDATDHSCNKNIRIEIGIKTITISDNGSGIAEKHIEKVFEPFFTTKLPHQGTGIGLSTVRHIVEEKLGGKIRVESIPGQKTAFIIDLP